MPDFRNDQALPDAPTLRRLSLLVRWAGETDEALRRPMTEICDVIDEMKRDVSLGLPLDRRSVARLSSLIDGVTRATTDRREIHTSILVELHDLGRVLCATVTDH